MKTIQSRGPGRVGRAMRRLAMAGYLVLAFGAHGMAQGVGGSMALDCSLSNIDASVWKMVTPLTSATPVGAILYQRSVSLVVSFKYGRASEAHELVAAGHWTSGPLVTNGAVPTNINGIGFKWAGVSGNGDTHTLPQVGLPMVTATHNLGRVSESGSDLQMMLFRQYLVLDKPVSQLPQGKLIVKNLPGNPIVAIYAIDLPKGVASVGGTVTVPEQTTPSNLCKLTKTFVGVGNVCIGSECEFHVPNRCEIQSDWVKPVTLGNFAITRFPALHAVSARQFRYHAQPVRGRGQAVDQFPRQGPAAESRHNAFAVERTGRPASRTRVQYRDDAWADEATDCIRRSGHGPDLSDDTQRRHGDDPAACPVHQNRHGWRAGGKREWGRGIHVHVPVMARAASRMPHHETR